MGVCPHCRQPTAPQARICPHCGLELPGRTRLGMSFPPDGKLGHTRLGPATEENAPTEGDAAEAASEPPVARRFESQPEDTWYGHQPRAETNDPAERPPEPPPRPAGTITRASPAALPEEAWFHVRGPATPRPRPVRKGAQRSPWPELHLWGTRVPLWVLVAAIALAGLAGAAVARFVPGRPALAVIGFEVSPDGRDVLTVSCAGCPDGSTLALGAARATLTGGVARLASSGLEVGENRLPLDLTTPNGRTSTLDVTVALAFRVSTDLRGITDVPPSALVVVSAPRGTSVTIAGAAVPSDPGVIRSKIDLSKDALGAESRVIEVNRKVPVRVLGPEFERSTHATITASVVPLVLDRAPRYQDGQLVVEGRAALTSRVSLRRGSEVLTEVPVDDAGRFVLRAGAHPGGPAIVAASAAGHVSRQLACQLPAPP